MLIKSHVQLLHNKTRWYIAYARTLTPPILRYGRSLNNCSCSVRQQKRSCALGLNGQQCIDTSFWLVHNIGPLHVLGPLKQLLSDITVMLRI